MNFGIITFFQILGAVMLIILVLLQTKGTGLGSTFGQSLGFYQTKRGVEKAFFYLTIVAAVIFLGSSVIGLL